MELILATLSNPSNHKINSMPNFPAIRYEFSVLDPKYFTGEVVPPATPRTSCGLHWGYTVRLARSFGAVFTESPYKVNCKYTKHVIKMLASNYGNTNFLTSK